MRKGSLREGSDAEDWTQKNKEAIRGEEDLQKKRLAGLMKFRCEGKERKELEAVADGGLEV